MNKRKKAEAEKNIIRNLMTNSKTNFHRIFEFVNNFYNWQAPLFTLVIVTIGEFKNDRTKAMKIMQWMNRNVHSIQFIQTVINTLLYTKLIYLWQL